MGKFDKTIRDIYENNEFFGIDYQDLLDNFDRNNETDEKVKIAMQLSLINVAFLDNVRGPISRPKFVDKILDMFRLEMIEDIKNRMPEEEENFNKDI